MNFRKFICLFLLVLPAFSDVQSQETTKPVVRLGIMAFTSPDSSTSLMITCSENFQESFRPTFLVTR